MNYFKILLASSILLIACKQNDAHQRSETSAETSTVEEFEKFGKEISADGALQADELFAKLENEDSVFVKYKTSVNAVCKKKGCWMTVPLHEETEMRVRFKDYEFFMPLNCEGRTAIIEGWAYKNELSVAMLKHYAEDAGSSQEEIDAITEPETEYTFMADGVLMN